MKPASMIPSLLAAGLLSACVGLQEPEARSESERIGWAGTTTKLDPDLVAAGRQIAQSKCAACHAIDTAWVSPNMAAPPLRDVLFTNDPDFIAYRFIDAIRMGHDEMPLFDFDARSADAIVAYIKSISGGAGR